MAYLMLFHLIAKDGQVAFEMIRTSMLFYPGLFVALEPYTKEGSRLRLKAHFSLLGRCPRTSISQKVANSPLAPTGLDLRSDFLFVLSFI